MHDIKLEESLALMAGDRSSPVPAVRDAAPPTVETEELSRADQRMDRIALILQLDAAGKSGVEISKIVGRSESVVSRTLAAFTDSRQLAKARLHGSADKMAKHVLRAAEVAAEKGDAYPALEVLDRTDALPNVSKRQGGGGNKVVVIVGGSDPRALPNFDVIDVTAESS